MNKLVALGKVWKEGRDAEEKKNYGVRSGICGIGIGSGSGSGCGATESGWSGGIVAGRSRPVDRANAAHTAESRVSACLAVPGVRGGGGTGRVRD